MRFLSCGMDDKDATEALRKNLEALCERGMSQQDVADRLGVTARAIRYWLSGQRMKPWVNLAIDALVREWRTHDSR